MTEWSGWWILGLMGWPIAAYFYWMMTRWKREARDALEMIRAMNRADADAIRAIRKRRGKEE